jgi:hypothetical protein
MCNHLTNFGSAFAVPMNPIDLSSPGFGDLNKNPTVFATYVCSVIMYCVLMIWAIKADRIDEIKVLYQLKGNCEPSCFTVSILPPQ